MVTDHRSPWDFSQWHGFARETDLATQLICAAANSIGHADYANLGDYYVALFGFANGLERLAKLVIAADFVRVHQSSPSEKYLRKYGHKLPTLIGAMRTIEVRRSMELQYAYPDDPMTAAIIDCLDLFADAGRGRYANIAALSGSKATADPVANWWTTVVEPILERHYRGTARESRDRENIRRIEEVVGQSAAVLHHNELGDLMRDIPTASQRTAECAVAQKYGRFYSLRLFRWMSDLYGDLVWEGAYQEGLAVLFGHEERVMTFRVPDHFILTRRRWPLL